MLKTIYIYIYNNIYFKNIEIKICFYIAFIIACIKIKDHKFPYT